VLRSSGKNNQGIGDFGFPNPKLSDLGKSDSPDCRDLQERAAEKSFIIAPEVIPVVLFLMIVLINCKFTTNDYKETS
jgi:hypothetical protein